MTVTVASHEFYDAYTLAEALQAVLAQEPGILRVEGADLKFYGRLLVREETWPGGSKRRSVLLVPDGEQVEG